MTSTKPDQLTGGGQGEHGSAGAGPAAGRGHTSIADGVVQKIAGIAAREISGVYELGTGAARAVGAVRERVPGTGTSLSQGVTVEVGEHQAAVDLDLVAEYGVALDDLAGAVRRNVIGSVERMTGLEVSEVNVTVDDVHIPGDDRPTARATPDGGDGNSP
ncbi:MAG TPA: Asp23/Gls24 family envelope stress response protein [Mycobacteriales bacterium]|nr:Asp23/Gls24 family envelope stress response protein [Mycobacteriales bacterium]